VPQLTVIQKMKYLTLISLIIIFSQRAYAENVVRHRVITPTVHSYSLSTNLKDKLVWEMNENTLTFGQGETGSYIQNENREILYTWEDPLEVSGAIASENGTALLVRIMDSGGYYRGATRFILADGNWQVDEVMQKDHPSIDIRNRWIKEIGAISDDGSIAILHIGEADSDKSKTRTSYRMFYGWQTWDLTQTERLGTGLTICNGRKDN